MRTLTINKASKLRLMVYGKAGSGKTYFCGTAGLDDRTSPVLHIDMGGNPESLVKLPVSPNTTVVQLDKLEDLDTIYAWLAANQPLDQGFGKKYQIEVPFKTVIFDGFTDMQRQSFDIVMGQDKNERFTALYPKREFSHYYFVLQQTTHMLSLLRKLDLHIIITALEHSDQRNDSTRASDAYIYAEPLLDGQARDEVPGYTLGVMRVINRNVDLVLANQLKARYSIGSFKPSKFQYAKDQHGLTMLEYGDPTITAILNAKE